MAGKRNPYILPDEQVAGMYESGMTKKQIAEICKCAESQIVIRLRRLGVKTRKLSDYPVTEKQRKARSENGKKCLGIKRSEETKKRISESKKKYRKRNDYEFGGHEKLRNDGYVKVFVPSHPYASKDGYVLKHRLLIERVIGRYLLPSEDVHHINHNRSDNRLENLQLMTHGEHTSLHLYERHHKEEKK